MNKTYNINLGGLPFQIDDEAFEKLNAYLDAVKRKFAHVQGNQEIVEDIEARMAEMFSENLHASSRKIVSLRDVNAAVETMGRPEEFEQGFEEEETTYSSTGASHSKGYYTVNKKLFRDPDDKVLGGVLSGLSKYFGLSSSAWLRVIVFALPILDIFGTLGISTTLLCLTYIVLWIAIPKAKTPTEKMQMEGEKIDLDNIERKVSDEFNQVKKNLNSDGSRDVRRSIGEVLGAIVVGFGKLMLGLILLSFVLIALALVISLFSGIIGVGATAPFLTKSVFGNGWMAWATLLGIVLLSFAPLVFIISLLIKLLFKTKTNMPAIAFGTLGAFILGFFLTTLTGVNVFRDFSHESTAQETVALNSMTELYLYGNKSPNSWSDGGSIGINKSIIGDNVDLKILPSKDSIGSIEIVKYAKGKNNEVAKNRVEKIEYNYSIVDNKITFNESLSIGDSQLWRAQEVDAKLRIPNNTILHIDESVEDILDYAKLGGERYSSYRLDDYPAWKYIDNQFFPIDENGERIIIDDELEDAEKISTTNDSDEDVDMKINLSKETLHLNVDEHDNGARVSIKVGDKEILDIDVDENGNKK